MARDRDIDSDDSLAIRAAWLHYIAGLTQTAVAKRLGVATAKAHRLITKAVDAGLVKVSITGVPAECAGLEHRICAQFDLDFCEVAPDLGESEPPLKALGAAGANFLQRAIKSTEKGVIGLGHGRTLAAAIRQLPHIDASGLRFVSLLGGLTRHYTANPHDVMHHLAAKTGAKAFVLPVPFFANSAEDRAVLLAQPGVQDIFTMAREAPLKLAGIGTADAQAQLVASGMIEPQEIAEITALGGVSELLGNFFDAHGHPVVTSLTARLLAVDLEGSENSQIVAVAGGPMKLGAIRSVLQSGKLRGLITDEQTAIALTQPPIKAER